MTKDTDEASASSINEVQTKYNNDLFKAAGADLI